MTGYFILADGRELKLPPLSKWKTCHTMGEPCDCFELSCPVDSVFAELLHTAVRFRGEYKGETVFFGIPDEMSFLADGSGLQIQASGRGMAALMLDNQLSEAEYLQVTLEELCDTYLKPLEVQYKLGLLENPAAPLEISSGASCWKVISGFTKQYMSRLPRFTKEGVMVLETDSGKKTLVVDKATGALLTIKRYGVISQLYINGVGYLYDENALSRGIKCCKVTSDAANAGYMMNESADGYLTLTVTLPEAFAAFPGDRVSLRSGVFDGEYQVRESESSGSGGGTFCTLTLKMEG